MAEDLTEYYHDLGVRVRYLHSDIETLERVKILRDLRKGEFDVLVGINLLREGLDLPEVSLVAILDADKEGFLRSGGSLIQTMGRAARHLEGLAILYADKMTDSMKFAIGETNRRRGDPVRLQRGARDHPGDASRSTSAICSRRVYEADYVGVPEIEETPEERYRSIDEIEKEIKVLEKHDARGGQGPGVREGGRRSGTASRTCASREFGLK